MYGQPSKRRRIKPYARPTSFDYNCRFDIRQYQDIKYNNTVKPFFQSASNEEVFRVMEGELLASKRKQVGYGNKELHCFSFANGLEPEGRARDFVRDLEDGNGEIRLNENTGQRDDPRIRMAILAGLRYVGVAVTEFSPARDVYEQGFVATIAGLNTLYNNGKHIIFPGTTVCLDLPEVRGNSNAYKRALQAGVPQDKLQFVLTPIDAMRKGIQQGGSGYTDELQDAARAANIRFDINNYIVGTAISYARPGDNVDIILHRINHYSAGGMMGGGDIGGGGGLGEQDQGDQGDQGQQAVPTNPGKKPQVKNKKSKKGGGN